MSILNRIVLSGFKSFKNKTAIPIQRRGLTAIVGENGSGKSNIIDGLTFVMGQRSSQLRANRLSQLIYNGGKNETPSKEALVTVHLDNTNDQFAEVLDRHLDNGHGRDEITIGRKVTKKSSTYKFMGNNCKRSVIDEVLDEANMDPSRHHIVNQGKITEIVNMSAMDRREIIDDLAGISKYDRRKAEAIEDLRTVKEKLMTNRVILGERRSQLTRLEKERDAALEYKEKEGKLELVESSITHKKYVNKKKELSESQEKLKRIKEQHSKYEKELKSADSEAEAKEKKLEELKSESEGEEGKELSKEVENLKMSLVKIRGEIQSARNEISNLEDTVEELNRLKNQNTGKSTKKNRSVKALLDRDRGGIYGTIGDLMEVKPKYQVAIETAVGGHLNDLVVDSRSTAIESVNYLKENELGRARFLPLMNVSGGRLSQSSKKAKKLPGVIDYGIELVQFDPKYLRAFQYVFRDTLIAEDLESVKDAENVRAVTLDGDVLSRGGAITGGQARTATGNSSQGGMEKLSKKIQAKKERIEKLKEKVARKRDGRDDLRKKLSQKESQLESQTQTNEELKDEISELEKYLNDLKKRQNELYRKTERQKRKKDSTEKDIQGLRRELEDLDKPDPSKEYLDDPIKELINQKRKYRRELDRLQPVNMKAIDEYEEFKSQVDELQGKLELLREEKREVERLIGKIEQEKKEKFYSTMNELSSHFEVIFKKLFDGGSAHLKLRREGDITSGLLIKAHPPDKELIVLDSLSGGEKTLTAIAFIFALQELNPAPVYVMDEIDAALDQRRSAKVADLLDDYAQDAQLILISHNEETAKHADQVFGVSMKNSKSDILSIKLN